MDDPTKAQKLASAMDSVISGSRDFNRQLAAQIRDELRSLNDTNANLRAALSESEARAEIAEAERDVAITTERALEIVLSRCKLNSMMAGDLRYLLSLERQQVLGLAAHDRKEAGDG